MAVFLARQQYILAGIYTIFVVVLVVRSYTASLDFRRQLQRHTRRNPALAHRYRHLWFICKTPHLCPRCRGWLLGLWGTVAAWVAAIAFYGYAPVAPVRLLGLPLSIGLGAFCLLITPIHGMLGRASKFSPKSVWDSDIVLGVIGFFSAFAAPLIASVFLLVIQGG